MHHDRAHLVLGVEEEDAARDVVVGGAFRQAVEADTGFAMAHRKLAVAYLNLGGRRSQALDAYDRAYRHRARLTERERALVVAAQHDT